jgi:hypothetical protein
MPRASASVELSGLATLTGTPDEVRKRLDRSQAERVIALTLEHGSEAAARALAETVTAIVPLVGAILERRRGEAIRSVIEALVPEVPPPRHMLIEARMAAEARKAVIESGDWLTAAQVAEMAGFSASNPSAQPSKWKRQGLVFSVRHQGSDYFPGYGLDPARDYRPVKGLAKILGAFRGKKDEWGLAYWFASTSSFLGGRRPQDVLAEHPERVLAAAEDELAGALHG